jgi:hypothetical protein
MREEAGYVTEEVMYAEWWFGNNGTRVKKEDLGCPQVYLYLMCY